ncbi:hypothetical protein [uncultured Winogradskyella sp.]|uniref:hypothetical protein n=1 Tax=uncultured Winogradskyella sp. TaxID=395353 RepID=UPI0026363534|nr:hypothetical protein [uncultured Winogradskyella sp.]
MEQETEQINQAIQAFLESIGETNMEATEIIFKERKEIQKSKPNPIHCEWVWDPVRRRLVWTCY